MNDQTTPRILREIQREIAEMREDRATMIESLDRLDAALNSLSAEMRILHDQFDRFRNDVHSQHDHDMLGCARSRDVAKDRQDSAL